MAGERRFWGALVLLLALSILSCSLGPTAEPTVEILSPPSGSRVALGEEVEIHYRATDEVAVVRVELEVDGRVVDLRDSPVPGGQPAITGILRWTPTTPGSHTLRVQTRNRDGEVSEPVAVSVIVEEGQQAEPTVTVNLLSPGPTVTAAPSPQATEVVLSTSTYDIANTVTLTNAGPGTASRIELWVALIRSREPYQEVLTREIEPAGSQIVQDEYYNEYALFDFTGVGPGEQAVASLTYRVQVRELSYDLSRCSGEVIRTFLGPETYVESEDELIRSLATQLADGQPNLCQTLRAIYDYVGDHVTYNQYEPKDHGAVWALEQGSGDCTEFTDATLALGRAAGIPTRFLEGVTYSAGGGSDLGQIKHDWVEAYLPGHGWVPLDPTWGRTAARRDAYFARMSPDHVVVTVGRNLSTLGGYHYYYYRHWWDGEQGQISADESWELTRVD
jgi:transglutaminase-like putative cysteine protease